MASIINASATGVGGVITTADASGVLQLQSNGTTIATISSTGLSTQVGAPTFSAWQGTPQTLSSNTFTKIQLQTEEWDTANCFDNATNFRFTPNVAGYYQVNGSIRASASFCDMEISIYKNGSAYKNGNYVRTDSAAAVVSAQVYFNGTTDYIELYGLMSIGQNVAAGIDRTYFQAAMIRSA